ncbi:hypothetical protein EUX98_g7708 [Antrodiella citrinella]|uniref:Uncharacterized protein n=1 Tax=Antrodiella citrinella TaxID=2447956 RepID=A0A4S4MN70_9APHY|nr:hypothetical protein EUX98_g7708 [Antrodiella citrinella]
MGTDSDMTILIDGESVGTFVQSPSQVTQYTSALVFQTTSLTNASHTFVIQNGHPNVPGMITNKLMLIDYLVYSHDDGRLEQPSVSGSASQNASGSSTSTPASPSSSVPSSSQSTRSSSPTLIPAVVVGVFLAPWSCSDSYGGIGDEAEGDEAEGDEGLGYVKIGTTEDWNPYHRTHLLCQLSLGGGKW